MGELGFAEGMMIGIAKRATGRVGNGVMVFDWDRAAQIIRDQKPSHVEAGLSGDWDYTGGPIYANGAIVPKNSTYTFLSSFWATPQIEIDGNRIDCFVMQGDDCQWGSYTYWPESARSILAANS